MNIRTRLSIQYILITLGLYITTMLVVNHQFKKHLIQNTYEDLYRHIETAESFFPLIADEIEKQNTELIHPLAYMRGNLRLYNQNLNLLFNFKSEYPDPPIEIFNMIKTKGQYEFIINNIQGSGKLIKGNNSKSYFIISEIYTDYRPLQSLNKLILLSWLILTISAATGAWYFSYQSLKPLHKINRDIMDIVPSDLSKRLPQNVYKNELTDIVNTFNSLLNKIETAVTSEKNYIANVSHELKNPLTSILSQLQYALNKSRNPDEYEQILNSIKQEVTGLTNTIEKLLQLARINSASNLITMEWVRLEELLYEIQENFKNKFPEYSLILNIENLPEDEEGLKIKINKLLFSMAILNLLENGGKYAKDNTVNCTVDFGVSNDIKLIIQNYGNLISESEQENLFQPFYRGHNVTQKGSGIGLSLVKAITDIHDIPIEIASNERDGNKFILHFISKNSTV